MESSQRGRWGKDENLFMVGGITACSHADQNDSAKKEELITRKKGRNISVNPLSRCQEKGQGHKQRSWSFIPGGDRSSRVQGPRAKDVDNGADAQVCIFMHRILCTLHTYHFYPIIKYPTFKIFFKHQYLWVKGSPHHLLYISRPSSQKGHSN